jgi:hypothetical protein
MAAINGVRVSATLVPTDTVDTFAVIDPTYGIDGWRSVADIATRNAIPNERRRQGMVVVVQAAVGPGPNTPYQLHAAPWVGDNTDWSMFLPSTQMTLTGDVTGTGLGTVPTKVSSYNNGTLFGSMAAQNSGAVNITGGTITGLPGPAAATDAATKAYVDASAQGLTVKSPVDAASTANVPLTGGATLTVDNVSLSNGSRLLLKDQTNAAQNGIYTVAGIGSSYTLTRSTDANTALLLPTGTYTFVNAGTVNTGSSYVLTTSSPITVDTTPLTWTKYSSATNPTPGYGISVTGDTVSIDTTWPGQAALTILGVVTTGTWQAGIINVPYGGTGLSSISPGDMLYGGSTANSIAKLPKGTSSQFLQMDSGGNNPQWTDTIFGGTW